MIFTASQSNIDASNLIYNFGYGTFVGTDSSPIVFYDGANERNTTYRVVSSEDTVYFVLYQLTSSGQPIGMFMSNKSFTYVSYRDNETPTTYSAREYYNNRKYCYYSSNRAFICNPEDIPQLTGYTYLNTFNTTYVDHTKCAWDMLYIINGGIEEYNDDPYLDSSTSGGGGGDGINSVSGNDINDPDLPELSAVSTGLVSIFNPSLSQLQALGSFLWSDLFSVDTFKKIFTDPWDAILGLSILGVGITGGTLSNVNIGNVNTGVSMSKLTTQYFKFDCGSITLKETWGSYLDYNPYTKISIYLPFIGTHALNVDDIMGKTISLKYNIDILSGACVANIKCGGSVLYSFTGSCSATIPLSGNSYTNMINGILGVATSIGASVATGGAAAPVTAATIAGSVMSSLKSDVSRTGNVSGMSGIMGIKTAYLIMEVPRICVPKNQNKYIGYPSYITKKVGDLSGYCVFEDIKIRGNSHATVGEIEEIVSIMKEGVYL